MENKARYNVLDDKIVIIVTLPDKVRDRPLRCLRFHYSRYQISICRVIIAQPPPRVKNDRTAPPRVTIQFIFHAAAGKGRTGVE